ncbi:hypothetical protein D5086_018290 [Populus alba]|uniref:Uncharacterized protein n=1 Tax=Populus alba TaxID=43335 RepID=A0ACC4BPZ8_POPAL
MFILYRIGFHEALICTVYTVTNNASAMAGGAHFIMYINELDSCQQQLIENVQSFSALYLVDLLGKTVDEL